MTKRGTIGNQVSRNGSNGLVKDCLITSVESARDEGKIMKRLIAYTIIVLLCVGILNPFTDYVNELEDTQDVSFNSSAVRIDITSPEFSMTADEVITFTATLYDSVNSVVAGEVSWSSSNGTITDDGTFYPGVQE